MALSGVPFVIQPRSFTLPVIHEASRPTCVRLNASELDMIEHLRREGTVSDVIRKGLRALYVAAQADTAEARQ